jgi:PAS domain S-box-containing protein
MKIKHQILLALLLMLVLLVGLGGVGSYYIHILSRNSGEIIKDNYRTLQYVHEMDNSLDAIQFSLNEKEPPSPLPADEILSFKENLRLQAANVTESGERELTNELLTESHNLIALLEKGEAEQARILIHQIKQNLNRLYSLNEDAVLKRNSEVQSSSEKVLIYMITIGAGTIILALMVIFSFPSLIIKPIQRFNESIKKVAKGDYEATISMQRKDEFGEMAYSFNKMVGKLKEYEESSYSKILAERNRLNAVINQMSEGIVGLDIAKRIIFANKKALKLLNLKRDELMGKYAPDVAVHNELLNSLISDLMMPGREWEERKFKPVSITEDRKEKLFSKDIIDVLVTPIGEEKPILSGHVILLTDVTEFSEKEKAKTAFMSTLSHELKTPVAAIEMGTDLLRNAKLGGLNREQQEWLQTIDENNQRIKQTINQVLDISKIERGLIELNRTFENPEFTIEKAVKAVEPFAKEKELKIEVRLDRPLPDILVDTHKITWVLNNILINAIRYTPLQGTISVKAVGKNTHRVRISVKDEGPGISRQQQELIFEPFKRVSGDKTDGLGLGLAISKEFVEAMGGQIGIISKEGEGAEFWVELLTV